MTHSGTLPSALSGASGGFALDTVSSDSRLQEPARNRLERMVHGMERSLPLPTSMRGYLLFLCWLVLIAGGMAILTLMSAQNLEARVELRQLNDEHTLIQQRNAELVWLIARETNLERIQRRLAGQGYVPATQVEYMVLGRPTREPVASTAATSALAPTVAAVLPAPYAPANGRDAATTAEMPTQDHSPAQDDSVVQAAPIPAPVESAGLSNVTALQSETPANWLEALAQGIGRWESIFRDNHLERAAPPLRSEGATSETAFYQNSTGDEGDAAMLNLGWEWSWEGLPEWRLFDNLPAWNELLPWSAQ